MKPIFTITEGVHGQGIIRFQWQQTTAAYMAVAGYNSSKVIIYDRHGEQVEEIGLAGPFISFSWDKDGDLLAIATARGNFVVLWDANARKSTQLDSNMSARDTLTFLTWSKSNQILAVGNSKGNLLLYDHKTQRKVPIIGKHTKSITCGAFNERGLLALGGDDSTISVSSSSDGDTIYSFSCHAEPSNIQFSEMKESGGVMGTDGRLAVGGGGSDNTVSAIVGDKTLMLINLNDASNPINLQFQVRYGNIVQYCWYGDGYILLGFEQGFVVCMSTHASEIGQEVFSVQDHKTYLSGVTISQSFGKVVTAGDSGVKMRELNNMNEVSAILMIDNAEKGLDKVELTPDGQLLAVSTAGGTLQVFLTRLPVLGDAYRTRIAYLTSLTEITVVDEAEQEKPFTFSIDTEPTFVGVGPSHVAIGMNNRAWFYRTTEEGAEFLKDKEYLGSVQSIKLNAKFACAMFENKLQLHQIQMAQDETEKDNRLFPDPDKSNSKISCMALTADFLIFGTDTGHLQYFFLDDWKIINEYRHSTGIRSVHPEPFGIRLIFVDEKFDNYVYNPINDSLIIIPIWTGNVRGILWDCWAMDKDLLVVYDNAKLVSYVYYRDTVEGSEVVQIGSAVLSNGFSPLVLYSGQLTCQTASGKTSQVTLASHRADDSYQGRSRQELENLLRHYLVVKKWSNAWNLCEALAQKEHWYSLGKAALRHMDVEFAARVYRQIGDIGMVWSLERLRMRRDLLHWDKALALANRLAPDQIPYISKEYAQQLEFMGDYNNALLHYENGLVKSSEDNGSTTTNDHNENCNAGIARTAIRLGDVRRGAKIAGESSNRLLKKECAQILEGMKQYNEAAALYERGRYIDKAAAVYVRSKNWLKVGELLPHVHSPKIHSQYAKAMEFEGKHKQAVEAYKTAKDYDNVVRILLEKLNNPEEAVRVVRESKSIEGAKLVAKFFLKLNDYSSAIQFLVLSHCHQEAFKLAENHEKMEIYADTIGDEAATDDYLSVAQYFESKKKAFCAGKFFLKCGHFSKAMGHLTSSGEDHESLKLAIECAAQSNDKELARKLMDFLLGETDGIPKDAKYLFRLYMALKMYREAAKTAVIIAGEEQLRGQYRVSHDVLYGMCEELRRQNIKVPSEMSASLMILHSYVLVKVHIKRGDHMNAARMLIRVAGNISKFPSHVVQILTSAVIECHRSGLKNSAFKFAAMLMRPEYRSKIDEKYRKKIEGIVRKPEKTEVEETSSPCLYCQSALPDTELTCPDCKGSLPYCIATGNHIVKDNFCLCPSCSFPALYTELRKLADSGISCPMCGEGLKQSQISKLDDEEIRKFLNPEAEE